MDASPSAVVERLRDRTNAHDLDGLVDCFTEQYVNDTPIHPARSFSGREQVRRNWEQIFAGVPDITTEILRSTTAGTTVWSEWEMSGTRRDGHPHLMRGVIIFEIEGDLLAAARFFLEPVDPSDVAADLAVGQVLASGTAPS
jgi:ketosteroid isomerase-like protein